MGNAIDFGKLANTVLALQQRVTTLEKVVERLNNGTRISQSEYNELNRESKEQVKEVWSELDLN